MADKGRRVLFVDDEPYFSRRYRDALRESFYVVYCQTYDEARYQLISADKFDVMVLDVMMPPPEKDDSAATGDGFETGLFLLTGADKLLGKLPPTVLLTNRSLDKVRDGLRKRGFDPDDRLFELRFKADTPARDLPGIVEDLLARQMRPRGNAI